MRALFQIQGNDTPKGNGKTIVREHETTDLRSKPFATQLVDGWNKLPEEVAKVESVGEFKERL